MNLAVTPSRQASRKPGAHNILRQCSLVAALAVAAPALAQTYTVTQLSDLAPSVSSQGLGINNSGTVVGLSVVGSTTLGSIPTVLPMAWSPSGLPSGLNLAGLGADGQGSAINNNGLIVGNASATLVGNSIPVAWTSGNPTALPTLGVAGNNTANAVNDSGIIAGQLGNASGNTSAVVWSSTAAAPTVLGDLGTNTSGSFAFGINSNGIVVGQSNDQAVVWNGSTPTALALPTAALPQSAALSINGAGTIVGYAQDPASGVSIPLVWNATSVTALATPSGQGSANAINNEGVIVGNDVDAAGNLSATVWSGGTMIDLNQFLSANQISAGWKLNQAIGINDAGSIVALGFNTTTGNSGAFLFTMVPEPQVGVFLLGGLLGAALAHRRPRP